MSALGRHPRGVIPPYMLRRIAERGTAAQRQRAIAALAASQQMRERRLALVETAVAIAPPMPPEKRRTVYSADNGSVLPGRPVRNEGAPATGDPSADEAYDGSGATYDLFYDIFDRNSIDDRGMRLDSTVHYLQGYDNAFWNGQQMVYGDGDEDLPPSERLFNRFTIAIDIIGHELTHGITQYTARLEYQGQSGALNESFSDVFGSLVKQRVLQQTARNADWLIGQGLFTANVQGDALRSMKAPGTAYDDPLLGKDPQPAHMTDYVYTDDDYGGVHINSGIPNHAFYSVASELDGYAWEHAGMIWYRALRDKLQPGASFVECAQATFQVAGELFGAGSREQQAVERGWATVGVSLEGGVEQKGCWSKVVSAARSLFRR